MSIFVFVSGSGVIASSTLRMRNFITHESASRGLEDTVRKDGGSRRRSNTCTTTGAKRLEHDPAYNPNLSLASADFTLAFPPRLTNPWTQRES